MVDIPNSAWSQVDSSNTATPPSGWPEAMATSGVNDAGRAMMGAIKRWYAWSTPALTGGSSTAYTLTYSVAPGALVNGMVHMVQFHVANGAAPTLNINALGALALKTYINGAWVAVPE